MFIYVSNKAQSMNGNPALRLLLMYTALRSIQYLLPCPELITLKVLKKQ